VAGHWALKQPKSYVEFFSWVGGSLLAKLDPESQLWFVVCYEAL